jgi:hypothetical protein
MPNLPPHNLSHSPLGGDPILPFDPANGIYICDDMAWAQMPDSRYQYATGLGGGSVTYYPNLSVNGTYDAYHKVQGIVEINSAIATTSQGNGACLARGFLGQVTGYQLGFGPCTIKSRICLNAGLQQKGNSSNARFGFMQTSSGIGTNTVTNVTTLQIGALILEYSPDNNGGNLRVGYTSGGSVGNAVALSYNNCTNAVPNFGQFEWWELDIDASLNVTALLNGNIIGTWSNLAPGNLPMIPIWIMSRNLNFATLCLMTVDDLYLYYPYNRR